MALPGVSWLRKNPGTALAERFREIGVSAHYVRRMTEPGDDLHTPLAPRRPVLFLDEPAAVAVRLFFCRQPVAKETAAECLGRDLLRAVLDAGLVIEAGPDRMVSPFHLRVVRELYLFSDYLGEDRDAVMGAGETTAILYQAGRPSSLVQRALDLGCGAGTLALLLASDAAEVVGTDVNPRAVAFARLNAAVNGKRNVEFRCGDAYAPVAGELFDVILSQPPYYPDPSGADAGQVFLHGGRRGDELSLRVVDGAASHLTPGGRAVVFTSWVDEAKCLSSDSLRVLELKTGRREQHGTRQSLNVIEHARPGEGWYTAFEVAADCWGEVRSRHIDRILAAEELLRGPRERLLAAALRLPEGTVPFLEGSQWFLDCPADSLLGRTAVDDATWDVVSAIDRARDVQSGIDALPSPATALSIVESSLRRGLLTLAEPGLTPQS